MTYGLQAVRPRRTSERLIDDPQISGRLRVADISRRVLTIDGEIQIGPTARDITFRIRIDRMVVIQVTAAVKPMWPAYLQQTFG